MMEALYKRKGKFGAGGREKRKECNKLNSRAKRDSLLASRRKMSVDLDVTKEARSPFSVKGKIKESKPNNRLQRLREWQQARDEAKAKSNQNKKPVFAVRGMGKPQAVVAKVNTNPSQSSFSAKKTILCASPKPARPGPISRVSKLAPQQAQKPAPLDTKITKKVQEPPQAQKQPAAKPAKKKKAELKPTQQVMPTRHSVRLAIKQTASSAAKQAAPDKDPPARSTKTSATRKGVGSTNKATVKKNSRACSEHKSAKGVRTSNRKKARPSPEKDNDSQNSTKSTEKGPIEDPMIEVPIPTTPKKSYQPVHPSPLLHCRSASKLRREAIYVPESMSVNDPAWIPGASAPEVEDKLGFEDAFGATFSPFRFTAGSESNEGSSFQFTFRMEANTGPNSTQSPEAGDKPARSSIVSESSMNISHVNENVSASLLEDLITFSDSSNCCTPPQEPTQKSIRITRSASKRRNSGADAENDIMGPAATKSPKTGSVRKSARKGRSSSKGYKPSQSVENEGADMDLSKPCKNSSPLSEIIVNSPGSTPTKAEPLHKSTKKNPSSSKQHKSSGVGMHRMGGEVVRNLELDYDKENVPHVEEQIDIGYFRELHTDACNKLEQLCEIWEEKAVEMEQDQDSDNYNKEEVLGQIRTTCCQARLLMRQKLHQYLGLVDMAETKSGEKKTTTEDLQGFWDMVYFQVDGLYTRFSELTDMENAGWQLTFPSPKKPKLRKRKGRGGKRSTTKQTEGAEGSERLEAARKKREAGRAKLRELRMKSSKSNEQQLSDGATNEMLIIC